MGETMKTLIPRSELGNVEAIMMILITMTPEQQKDLLSFLQGVIFSQSLATQ